MAVLVLLPRATRTHFIATDLALLANKGLRSGLARPGSAGLGLVGELSRSQIYLVVFAIWALQLFYSQWWLRHYRFGPAEWLWRSLTYWKRQPFRHQESGAAP